MKSKSDFNVLCKSYLGDDTLSEIFVKSSDGLPVHLGARSSLKIAAWNYYKSWRSQGVFKHPNLGDIYVNRMGWKHITRTGRGSQRIIASWLLLPIAKHIIENVNNYKILDRIDIEDKRDPSKILIRDYVGIRVNVNFNYRDSSVVQVILKRERLYDVNNGLLNQNIWFYSVFELRRGKVQ